MVWEASTSLAPKLGSQSVLCSSHKLFNYFMFSYANRVEDLYAAWPAIMTINSTYGRYILEPLLRFQVNLDSVFALPDLGKSIHSGLPSKLTRICTGNTYPIVNGGNPNSEVARNLAVEGSAFCIAIFHVSLNI